MQFNEIVTPSMKEMFIKSIESMILSGELGIGDKLPTERELATQMKVSRTIVNLGLNELQNKGFITIVPRKGTYVADYIRNGKLETLMSIINFNGGSFDKKIFNSLMEYRIINEGIGAYLAALKRTDSDMEIMENLYKQMLSSDSLEETSIIIFDFHHAIFYATGNYIYPLVHNSFRNISIILTTRMFKFYSPEQTIRDIKVILDMIKIKDAKKAKLAMEKLIKRGTAQLKQNYFNKS